VDIYAAASRALAEADSEGDGDEGVLWARLEELVDPAETRPALAPDVELKRFSLRWGNDYAMIRNPRDLIHFRLEPSEADLVELMDGTRTVKEIVVQRMEDSGDMELSAAAELVEVLAAGNFLQRRFVDVGAAVERALQPPLTPLRRVHRFLTTLQAEWGGAERLVRWLYDHGVKYFFDRRTHIVILPIVLGGFAAFLYLVDSGRFTIGARSPAL